MMYGNGGFYYLNCMNVNIELEEHCFCRRLWCNLFDGRNLTFLLSVHGIT